MLECAMVCLLASSVGIKTAKNETACSYCIDARSSHENCFDNVIDCAYRDPHGIIFCTNFFETEVGEEFIQRQTRCISYYDLLISDDTIRGIVANGNCNYKDRQYCDCPATCPGRNITNGGWPFDVPTTTKKPPRFPKGERKEAEGISVTIKTPSQLVEEKQPRFGVSFIERAELYVKDMWGAIVSPASAENGQHGFGLSLSLVALTFGLLAA